MFTKRKPIAKKRDVVGVITPLSEPTVLEILAQASVFQAVQAAQKKDMRTKKWTSKNSNSSNNNNNNNNYVGCVILSYHLNDRAHCRVGWI